MTLSGHVTTSVIWPFDSPWTLSCMLPVGNSRQSLLVSHPFSLCYPASWLFSHSYSACAVTRHFGHYNRYYVTLDCISPSQKQWVVAGGEHCGVKATVRLVGAQVGLSGFILWGPKSVHSRNGLQLLVLRHIVSLLVGTPLRIVNCCWSGFPCKWRYINVETFNLWLFLKLSSTQCTKWWIKSWCRIRRIAHHYRHPRWGCNMASPSTWQATSIKCVTIYVTCKHLLSVMYEANSEQ